MRESFQTSCSTGDKVTPVYKPEKYDGKWSSSTGEGYLTKNGSSTELLHWNDIPWKVRDKYNGEPDSVYANEIAVYKKKKNKEFSVSFWIFTNATVQTDQWQRPFCVIEQLGQIWDRCPAIFLWCCNVKALHIRSRGTTNGNMGLNDEDFNGYDWKQEWEKWYVPVASPLHVTIVFTGSVSNIYYNGEHKGIIELRESPADIADGYIMVGQNDAQTPNSYVMKDVAIYNEPLGAAQVKCIYQETSADRISAEKALGINVSSYEAFSSLKENFITDLPQPNLIADFNSYKIITDIKENAGSNTPTVETNALQPYSTNGSSVNGQYTTTLSARDFGFNSDKQLTYFQFDMDKKQYINIPTPLKWTTEGLTFSLWYRVTQKSEVWPRLFDFGDGPGNNNVLVACLYGGLQFYVFGYGIVHAKNWELNYMNHNTWNHLTWTLSVTNPAKDPKKDPSFGQWKIYINGTLKTTMDNMLYPYSTPDYSRQYQYVGKSNWTDQYKSDQYIDGSIGDFRIYNRALNDSQVRQVFSLQ